MHRCAVITLLALASASALAQPVYRCGSSYSQTPCPEGKVVEASDPRSAGDAARSEAAARADARRAQALEQARVAQEARAPQAMVMGAPGPRDAAPAPARRPASAVKLAKGGKLEQFIAVEPRRPKPERDEKAAKR